MCGIAGIFYKNNKSIEKHLLVELQKALKNRGPDASGRWQSTDKSWALIHTRLAIIDLDESANQPMEDKKTNFILSFNGEIYNYIELRDMLIKAGYKFHTKSDTEVLLKLYEYKGSDMFRYLRGMYAFAIVDNNKKTLFLARDSLGIKPLYFYQDSEKIIFSSQVKSINRLSAVKTSVSSAGMVGYYIMGSVPEPFTMYNEITCLKAGCYREINLQDHKYVDGEHFNLPAIISNIEKENSVKAGCPSEVLHRSLHESVKYHFVSDVPVGLFLSSGIDSSALAAYSNEVSGEVDSFTIAFSAYTGTELDETQYLQQITDRYNLRPTLSWIKQQDFYDIREQFYTAMDQPTIDGLNTFLVSKFASTAGLKVAMSGLGGDELFGGYPGFNQIPRIVNFNNKISLPAGIARTIRKLSHPIIKRFSSPKYSSFFEYGNSYGQAYLLRRALHLPWELTEFVDVDVLTEGLEALNLTERLKSSESAIKNPQLKITSLEMSWYMRNQLLRDSDWASMHHSLELRVPLVDKVLLSQLLPCVLGAKGLTKQDFARSPAKKLPEAVVNRKKSGFAVPVRDWMSGDGNTIDSRRGLRGWSHHVMSQYQKVA